jgi:hypothetical protein
LTPLRKRQKGDQELAQQMKEKGLELPSHLEAEVARQEKKRERNRAAMAAKRSATKMSEGSRSISIPKSPIGPLPVRTWIDDVIQKWDSHPISSISSLHSVGLTILRKLASLPVPPPRQPVGENLIKILGFPTRGCISPNLRLVGNDLLDGMDHNVVDFISRDPEINISGRDILFSMMAPLVGGDMNSPERRLYGALDIRFSNNGIKLCEYRASPYDTDNRCTVHPNQWTITLTPAGAITHTHMDYYGREQFFIHLFGQKIWLLWPPTKKNLDIFAKYHTQRMQEDLIARSIDELEGLEVFYTTEEQAFLMRPNVLHACMSVGVASHLGAWVWRLEEYRTSFSMIDWGLDWVRGKSSTDAPITDYIEEFRIIKCEIAAWKQLVKDNPNDGDSEEVKKSLKELEAKASKTKSLFPK